MPWPNRFAVAIRLEWTCLTPLGSPVEPEVYIQNATSSDNVSAVKGVASALVMRASKPCIAFPSWPGLSRPSTSFPAAPPQDVDARDKRGRDDEISTSPPTTM